MERPLINVSVNSNGISVYYNFSQYTIESEFMGLKSYRKIRDNLTTPDMTGDEKKN